MPRYSDGKEPWRDALTEHEREEIDAMEKIMASCRAAYVIAKARRLVLQHRVRERYKWRQVNVRQREVVNGAA